MVDLSDLAGRQNPDGGWPYTSGSSCTEPTIWSLLALVVAGEGKSASASKGSAWLARYRLADGGWPPRPNVDRSTWVTALALLLPVDFLGNSREPALAWLNALAGRESSWILRIRSVLMDGRIASASGEGWPWFPETAAWVSPTCFGLLALEKAGRARPSQVLEDRCASARQYLTSHTCRDGGWNHGSTKALGYDSDSYPETTGQALLALHRIPAGRLRPALERARQLFETCKSREAMSWLKMGLLAHGQPVPDLPSPKGHGGVQEIAVGLLADAAAQGRNVFLE